MYRELLELAADGENLYDMLGPDFYNSDSGMDNPYTANYECSFCGDVFEADADELQFIRYNEKYGCGCLPERVIRLANDAGIQDQDIASARIEYPRHMEEISTWRKVCPVYVNGELLDHVAWDNIAYGGEFPFVWKR